MFNLLAEVKTPEPVNWMLEILKMFAPAVLVLFGLWVWHLKKRSEPKYESLGFLEQKRLEGLMKVWSLLAYITEVENPKAVMVWERGGGDTEYYLRPHQARGYIVALAEVFYENGYGLFLGRRIKDLLYEYRNQLYGVLLRAKSEQDGNERIKLENEDLIKCLKRIYTELNDELRKELKKIEG